MNDTRDSAVLLTFVTTNEDGTNKINLYGTPSGLKNLAAALIRQAETDQSTMPHLGDYDTDHTHFVSSHSNSILSPSSDEIQMGRLDLRTGDLAYWAKERIASSEISE